MLKWFRKLFTKRHIVKLDLTAIVNDGGKLGWERKGEIFDDLNSLVLDIISAHEYINATRS